MEIVSRSAVLQHARVKQDILVERVTLLLAQIIRVKIMDPVLL